MNMKIYKFDAVIQKVPGIDGAYIDFPFDVQTEFGKGRVAVHATFDGVDYDGILVRMGTPHHIIGLRKDIRAIINKQAGDVVHATIKERAAPTKKDWSKTMPNSLFVGPREKWSPLYAQLKKETAALTGPFNEHITISTIIWRHHTSFAELRAKNNCLVVGLPSNKPHQEWGAVKITQTSANRATHYFEITDASAFPALLTRLKHAHELTMQNPVRKTPAKPKNFNTVDEYIAQFPKEVQVILQKVKQTIKEAAPNATEKISWQMPTYHQKENLVHFAASKNHLGFYPSPKAITDFAAQLAPYSTTKGAVQFPYSLPIPYALIAEITRYRVNLATQNN